MPLIYGLKVQNKAKKSAVHAHIQLGANLVARRRKAFTGGVLILMLFAALNMRPFLGL